MVIALVAIAVMAVMMLLMSVGVVFSGRCLRGSCGGPDMVGPDGESLLCATCPQRRRSEPATDGQDLVELGGA